MLKKRSLVRWIIGAFVCCLSLSIAGPVAHADPSDPCFLAADKGWVRISLYREVGNNGKGEHLWTLDFPKGASRNIKPNEAGPSHRLRYDYANAPTDPLHGNVGFTCQNHDKIVVPN
jgi:hypothetical protein